MVARKPGDIIDITAIKDKIFFSECIATYYSEDDIPLEYRATRYSYGGKCPDCGYTKTYGMTNIGIAVSSMSYPLSGVYCAQCGLLWSDSPLGIRCPICRKYLDKGKYIAASEYSGSDDVLTLNCPLCKQQWEVETIIGIYNSGDSSSWFNPNVEAEIKEHE